ncbi:anti-sigma factor family protein [Synoicihabitans lomoniglobus]|uniref:Uncharacterized protein n=1 Tax=Synoicihabitans lomoniglobus TaxID=2909285 RepID=A0AAF0I560_9BACT|nr:zf-HC2 domain-containing protein [Opitutaceae bacterium LMO-M01]WED66870.1 hypothetical protein PXH66_08405 [Opitutaceae bacterium LMO-M01]
MNDERFIEQLNLYIDRELSQDDVREIEAAIAASPERQKIYAQYCKVERACQQVFAPVGQAPRPSIAALVAAAEAEEEAEVVAFRPAAAAPARSSGWGWGAATGLVAACAAFAVYFGSLQSDPALDALQGGQMATVTPSSEATRLGLDDDYTAANRQSDAYRTVLFLEQSPGENAQTLRVAAHSASDDPLAWMARMQFAPIRPIQVDSLEFKTAQPMPVRSLSAFAYPYPGLDDSPPISESAAFEFQR